MARRVDDQCAKCRYAGDKLFLKGEKCLGPKCTLVKRNYPPGAHGQTRKGPRKISSYGKQLREKQKAKQVYGLMERQFANYVAEASKKTGDTSIYLLNYLESRLDNVVYRMGLTRSRAAARQMVNHGHITVNGKKVDIPSYRVRVGEVVAVKENSLKKPLFDKMEEKLTKVEQPSWLAVDAGKLSAKILNQPTAPQAGFDAKSIIEFYSR